jgi:hypothetical protein
MVVRRKKEPNSNYLLYAHVILLSLFLFLSVCVCVCENERERQRDGKKVRVLACTGVESVLLRPVIQYGPFLSAGKSRLRVLHVSA